MARRRERSRSEPAGRAMPDAPRPRLDPDRPIVYRIRVRGHLDDRWSDPDEGRSVTRQESGDTVLTIPVLDQAALHGLLRKLRDLGVPLVSINPAGPGQTGDSSEEENR